MAPLCTVSGFRGPIAPRGEYTMQCQYNGLAGDYEAESTCTSFRILFM